MKAQARKSGHGPGFRRVYTGNMTTEEPYLALQVLMMPKDTNGMLQDDGQSPPRLTIFGGVILSYIDQAAAIGAHRAVLQKGGKRPFLVTVAMNRIEFHKPVFVGDVVRLLTWVVKWGRTSVTMHVRVEADRGEQCVHVTEAEVVYVGVDAARRPTPLLPGAS